METVLGPLLVQRQVVLHALFRQTRGCCQQGWVWRCRAPRCEVKLQAVSGRTNTQLCPTWRAWGEKIQEAFPRDMGVSAWMRGCQPAPWAPPATRERMCKGRRPNWLGLAGSRSWDDGRVAAVVLAAHGHPAAGRGMAGGAWNPKWTLCTGLCSPLLWHAPQVIPAVLLDGYRRKWQPSWTQCFLCLWSNSGAPEMGS